MEDDRRVGDLVGELVCHLQRDSSSPPSQSNPNPNSEDVKYAIRILSSRMTPLIVPNEAAMANSIKSHMAKQGKLSDALTFADLYTRLASKTGPGSVKNKHTVLYLLKVISEDRSSNPKFQTDRSSTDSNTNENHPNDLKHNPKSWNDNLRALRDQNSKKLKNGGVLSIFRDPDDTRDMAYREFATLVNMESDVSEEDLVSDVLSVCQGIDGKYVKFDVSIDGYILPDSIKAPKATRIMIRKLCELGWLYQKVIGYICENIDTEKAGKVTKSFCSALQDELLGYNKLLTVLQSHHLSLRRLSIWLLEPTVKMRRMAVLVDSCRSLKGGAMAGAIHLHAQHGDPLLHDFMKQLLQKLSSPLFEMVRSWVLEGDLQDPHTEFFIAEQSVKPESLWREGYKLNYLMLPSFISQSLAKQILRTGKSINFLKVCCNDHTTDTVTVTVTGTIVKRGGFGLGYGETNALESLVTESSKRIDKYLQDVIFNKYKFKQHCLAIKRYILLGQGDFVQYLMEIINPVLMDPANTISLIHLSGLLQKAVISSSAQYDDPDILNRLTVKMMPHGTKGIRQIGWDVFTLDYNPRAPLNTIFTESAMRDYLKIFKFLWKIKRVEHGILHSWKSMKPNLINSLLKKLPKTVVLKFEVVLRTCQIVWGQMSHFLTNFQSYVMFEVLEVSWCKFCNEMESSKDLDDLINAHEKYLSSIIEKSLLGESCEGVNKSLLNLFDVMLRFVGVVDRVCEGVFEFGGGKGKVKKGKGGKGKCLESESWIGEGRKGVMKRAGEFVSGVEGELEEVSVEYLVLLKGFICQLAIHQEVDLKFLMFRLDFTEFYS